MHNNSKMHNYPHNPMFKYSKYIEIKTDVTSQANSYWYIFKYFKVIANMQLCSYII